MRGLLTILPGKELSGDAVSTVLVVCTGDALHCPQIVAHLQNRFPKAQFTYVARREYLQFFPDGADVRLTSEIKKAPFRGLWNIRRQKFDVAVLMLTGQPGFRGPKLWALFTNYRTLLVYNENIESSTWCRANWRVILRHIGWRLTEKGFPGFTVSVLTVFLFPLGIVYLLVYTSWATFRSRIRMFASKTGRENQRQGLSVQGPAAE